MIKFIRNISFLFLLFQIFGCDTVYNKNSGNKLGNTTQNVFGLYSYDVTGYNSHCEWIKHSLQLNQDSTFIFKIYCYADSTSPFKQTIKIGKWTKLGDSIFHFICSDTTTFDMALLANAQMKIIRPKIDDRINFEFSKDTSKNESDLQKPSNIKEIIDTVFVTSSKQIMGTWEDLGKETLTVDITKNTISYREHRELHKFKLKADSIYIYYFDFILSGKPYLIKNTFIISSSSGENKYIRLKG